VWIAAPFLRTSRRGFFCHRFPVADADRLNSNGPPAQNVR